MTPIQKLDERRAAAIWNVAFPFIAWEKATGEAKAECIKAARAIRESDEAAGLVMVPRDVVAQCGTHHMNCPHAPMVKAAIAASPYAEPSP